MTNNYKLKDFLEKKIFDKTYLFKIHFLGYRHAKSEILDCMDIFLKSKDTFYIIKCDNSGAYHKMDIVETNNIETYSFYSYAYNADKNKLIDVKYYIPKAPTYLKNIECEDYTDASRLSTNVLSLYDFKIPSVSFNYIIHKDIEMKKITAEDFIKSIANEKELDFLLCKLKGNDLCTKQCLERNLNKKEKNDDKSR